MIELKNISKIKLNIWVDGYSVSLSSMLYLFVLTNTCFSASSNPIEIWNIDNNWVPIVKLF